MPYCLWAVAQDFSVVDASDNEIHVQVLPAGGDLLAIWLLDHGEKWPLFESMLWALNAAGVEVWRADLLADYFLPRSSESVRTLPGGGVGFSVDASVRIEADDRAGLERLLCYCARPPFALEQLEAIDMIAS